MNPSISTIIGALITSIIGALIGGLAVKYYDLRKTRFEFREKWIGSFREGAVSFLSAIERHRLSLYWPTQDEATKQVRERLLEIYSKSVAVQLMVRPEKLENISKDQNNQNERDLNKLIIDTQKELDTLWGKISDPSTQPQVVKIMDKVQKQAINILYYNWSKIEKGLDPYDGDLEKPSKRNILMYGAFFLASACIWGLISTCGFDSAEASKSNAPQVKVENLNICYGDTAFKAQSDTIVGQK